MKNIYILIYKFCFQLVYNCAKVARKTDRKKMIIALNRTERLDDNLLLVYKEVLKQDPEMKIHLVRGENKMNLKLFKEVVKLSNASYLVLDDYYLPIYLINPQKKLKVIQLWHAAGALKKFGYSTVGSKFGATSHFLKLVPIHSNYDYVYISAKKFVKFYSEAFNMNSEYIFPIGIPRTDILTDKSQSFNIVIRLYKKYPSLKNKNLTYILMAPTYRANGVQTETQFDVLTSVIKLSKMLDNDKRIIFKPHPYMNNISVERLKKCPNIFIAETHSINEWMLVSDAFITDYSSSVFEFALLKKPMAHFVPDIGDYKKNRGFYNKLEDVSDGVIIKNINQLADWINARKKDERFNSNRMISYNFDHVNNTTARIVQHFLSTEK